MARVWLIKQSMARASSNQSKGKQQSKQRQANE